MKQNLPILSARDARRLFMGAQGLLDDPSGATAAGASAVSALRELIARIGFVQLDSINVVERAHHLTLVTRLHSYRHEHLTRLLEEDRSLFEHWTHDASAIPVEWFRQWKPRFARSRSTLMTRAWWRKRIGEEPERVINLVRKRIVKEGPLRSQDFEHDRRGESAAWWGWKPQKAALEFLWTTGELMVTRRVNFHKVYDLTERVLPDEHIKPHPTETEHIEWACRTALDRLAVATPKEIADFWHTITPTQAAAWCARATREGRAVAVLVEDVNGAKQRASFALPDWKQRLNDLPEPPAGVRLLCPFDPVLRDRARVRRLFDFDYRFEAFVPSAKRQYGYYVLPVLEGDKLVGRVDPKFDRAGGVLEIRRVFWEPGVRLTAKRLRMLDEAAHNLARFIGADKVEWTTERDRHSDSLTLQA